MEISEIGNRPTMKKMKAKAGSLNRSIKLVNI